MCTWVTFGVVPSIPRLRVVNFPITDSKTGFVFSTLVSRNPVFENRVSPRPGRYVRSKSVRAIVRRPYSRATLPADRLPVVVMHSGAIFTKYEPFSITARTKKST